MFFLLSFFVSGLDSNFPFECNDFICPTHDLYDGACDTLCMTPVCNYDSSDFDSTSWTSRFDSSGCIATCKGLGCDLSFLGDSTCDQSCNIIECGFDLGDCGYCASGCSYEMLTNNICDPACDAQQCMYDNNACGWCKDGCFLEDLASSTCTSPCNNPDCNYQDLVCDSGFCAPGCSPTMQNGPFCYAVCNNAACDYNNNLCLCSAGCTTTMLADTTTCHTECDNSSCDYQNYVCGYCASDCFYSNLGDGICDSACNVANCGYDWGDCSCAPGCASHYSSSTSTWTWDSNSCNVDCLVEDCLFNYGVCTDGFSIRAAWFQQLDTSNPGNILSLSTCYADYPSCTLATLQSDDTTGQCTSACSSSDCLYCMGLNEVSSSCTRYNNADCYLCKNNYQIYDYCSSTSSCPPGFAVVNQLTAIFEQTNVCLRDTSKSSPNNYSYIYVATTGTASASGTSTDPISSPSAAFQKITMKFTKVMISPGNYQLALESATNPLITDTSSPLMTVVDLHIQEVWIQGTDSTNRPIIYLTTDIVKLYSRSKALYIKNIIFNGQYSLMNGCNAVTCMYCPYIKTIIEGNFYKDDRGNVIQTTSLSQYAQNCASFNSYSFITVPSGSTLELDTVDVVSFQQQFYAFINAQGSVTLKTVNFIKSQASSSGAWIYLSCTSGCSSVSFTYTGGSVTNFNYGYEFLSTTYQSGFLTAKGTYDIDISNVSIDYAMVVSGSSYSTYNYFISAVNIQGTVTITDCTFSNSLVNSMVYIDASTISYTDLTMDSFGNFEEYKMTHFSMSGTSFTNVGSILCLLCQDMDTVLQNTDLDTCTFTNIVANGGVLNIANTGGYTSTDQAGGWSIATTAAGTTLGWVTARSIVLNALTFSNVYYGDSLISITEQPNINVTSLTTTNTYDLYINDFTTLIVNQFSAGGSYLSKDLLVSVMTENSCSSLISIATADIVGLEKLTITNTNCLDGYLALHMTEVSTANLTTATISQSTATTAAGILTFDSIPAIYLTAVTLQSISLEISSAITIRYSDFVNLTDITGNSVCSTYGSPLYLKDVLQTYITKFSCNTCISSRSHGGAIYILPTTLDSIIWISYLTCNYCEATSGNGGTLYIESYSIKINLAITISNVYISGGWADDGAALYIAETVSLSIGYISNITVENTNGSHGAVITDLHKFGKLFITDFTASGNNGIYSGIRGDYSFVDTLLTLTNVFIVNPTSTSSIFSFSSLVSGTTVSVQNLTISQSSSLAFLLDSISLLMNLITINSGSGISSTNSVKVNATNLNFTYLSSYAYRGISSSSFTCTYCNFQHLTGGTFTVEGKSTMQVYSSFFYNVTSSSPGSILYMNICNQKNLFYNCTFLKCGNTNGALVDAQSSTLNFTLCLFTENNSTSMTPGISLIESTLVVMDCIFTNQSSVMGSFIYASTLSTVTATSSTFRSGIASNAGGAIISIMSDVTLSQCTFFTNTANFGGALYGITLANFTIDSCFFVDNYSPSGSSIYFTGNVLSITNSILSLTSASIPDAIIYLASASSFVFTSSTISGYEVPGILSLYSQKISLINSNFSNLNNAVTVSDTSTHTAWTYKVMGCTFANNTGSPDGGALSLSGISMAINSSIFLNNSAINGGAYASSCAALNCNITIDSSTFQGNNASDQGGAINWKNRKPVETNNTFANNYAPYGSVSASIPALLGSPSTRARALSTTIDCAPGQACSQTIQIQIMDSSGNVITNDDSSVANIIPQDAAYSVSGTTKATAVAGVFTFVDYILSGTPGTSVIISITTSSIDPSAGVSAGDPVTYENSINYTVKLRDCVAGEQIGTTTCTTCLANTYLLEPADSCKSCPTGGKCTGGWAIYPENGYWRSSNYSELVYACSLAAACLGSASDTDYNGACFDGYTGNECFACEVGYSRSGTNKCALCPSTVENVFIIISLLIFIIFVAAVMVRSTLKSAYSPKALHSIYIKIFTNYLQLVFLTTQFDLKWPWYVLQLFSVQQSVASASDQIFSLDCYFTSNGASFEDTYYNKLIITACLPLIIWAFSLVFWIFYSLLKHKYDYLKRELFTTMIILFFLVYPNIVKAMFAMFSCTNINKLGYFVTSNLVIKCYDESYIAYSLLIGFTSIILWAVGVPTIVLVIMAKRRKFLNTDQNRVIFGFLFNGYKKSRFFWEFVIMYRKIVIICISVFLSLVGTSVQALTLTLVLLVSLFLQYELKPFNKHQLNHMETEAILTAAVTIYCGLYYLADSEIDDAFKGLLFFLMVLGNSYFIAYWLYYMMQSIIDLLCNSVGVLRKITGNKDPYHLVVSDEGFVKKGVLRNDEEGILTYTMLQKNDIDKKEIKMKNTLSMKDLYRNTLRLILEESRYKEPSLDCETVKTLENSKDFDDDKGLENKNQLNSSKISRNSNREKKKDNSFIYEEKKCPSFRDDDDVDIV